MSDIKRITFYRALPETGQSHVATVEYDDGRLGSVGVDHWALVCAEEFFEARVAAMRAARQLGLRSKEEDATDRDGDVMWEPPREKKGR